MGPQGIDRWAWWVFAGGLCLAGHTTVLLVEASHGTSEFYRARERITRGLVDRGAISDDAAAAVTPLEPVTDEDAPTDGPPETCPFAV